MVICVMDFKVFACLTHGGLQREPRLRRAAWLAGLLAGNTARTSMDVHICYVYLAHFGIRCSYSAVGFLRPSQWLYTSQWCDSVTVFSPFKQLFVGLSACKMWWVRFFRDAPNNVMFSSTNVIEMEELDHPMELMEIMMMKNMLLHLGKVDAFLLTGIFHFHPKQGLSIKKQEQLMGRKNHMLRQVFWFFKGLWDCATDFLIGFCWHHYFLFFGQISFHFCWWI